MKTFLLLLFGAVTVNTYSDVFLQDFKTSNWHFTSSVSKKIFKNVEEGNLLLSPLSTQTILALTQSGCRGETAREILSAINLTKIESTFENLNPLLNKNQYYTVRTANKIYVKNDFPVRPDFTSTARKVFQADCENIDFSQKQFAARTINSWVETTTENKIRNLIEASRLNERSRVVLVNALYFKADWSKKFPIAYTREWDFFLTARDAVKVPRMVLHEKSFNYSESASLDARFLELPFQGNEASMVIALPNRRDGISSLISKMRKVLQPRNFVRQVLNVGLPRFRIETSMDLKPVLKKLGISRVFDDFQADLSGIAGNQGDLAIDKIAQKTFIDVSEEGVEAAAATYAVVAMTLSAPSEIPKKFIVDRPFIFYIQVRGIIIFVGRVVDPRF